MNPGDQVIIHMHDTPDGLRIELTDTTTRQTGSMTASVAQWLRAHPVQAWRPQSARRIHTPSIPSTAQPTPAATRGRRIPTTWRSRMRSAISRTASTLDADFNCAVSAGDEADGTPDCDDVFVLRPGRGFAADQDQRLLRRATATGRTFLRRTRRTGPAPTPIRPSRCHSPIPSPVLFTSPLARTGTRTIRTWSSRPTFPGSSLRLQLNPPFCNTAHRRELCQSPRPGPAFYPIYSTRMAARDMHLAARRPVHPWHDRRLRRHLRE